MRPLAFRFGTALLTGLPLFGTIYATLIGVNGSIELVAAIILVPVIVAAIKPGAKGLSSPLTTASTWFWLAPLIIFGAPVAMVTYTMAVGMQADDELAGTLVAVTSVFSILSMFLFIFVLKQFAFI